MSLTVSGLRAILPHYARPFRHNSPGCTRSPLWTCVSFSTDQHFSRRTANAAHTGSPRQRVGQNNLGLLYDLGDGVPQDYAVARQWYEKAAAQNHASAQFNLGLLYANGHGVPQDYAMARQWYEKAAAQGNADARGWFEKAAAQGNTNAQFYLGSLYEKGDGVPRNYAEATKWYEKAAVQGDADAQFSLGLMYATGDGVPQDDVRAYLWFTLAVAHSTGNKQKSAATNRDGALTRRMTPVQIAEAQKLAREWKPKGK